MGNPNPKNQFKKGVVTNPLGRGAENPVTRQLRKLTGDQLAEMSTILLEADLDKLEMMFKDKKTPAIQKCVIAIVIQVIKKGDASNFIILLDRIIGRVKQEIKHSGQIKNTGMTNDEVAKSLEDPHTRKLALELAERLADDAIVEGDD